jgi:hypothetical protein
MKSITQSAHDKDRSSRPQVHGVISAHTTLECTTLLVQNSPFEGALRFELRSLQVTRKACSQRTQPNLAATDGTRVHSGENTT